MWLGEQASYDRGTTRIVVIHTLRKLSSHSSFSTDNLLHDYFDDDNVVATHGLH